MLDQSISLERLAEVLADGTWPDHLYAPDEALLSWRAAILGDESETRLRNGLPLRFADTSSASSATSGTDSADLLRAYSADGRFLGVLRWDAQAGSWHPHKVLLVEPVTEPLQ